MTSKLRDMVATIDGNIKTLEDKSNEMNREIFDLHGARNAVLLKIIEEEQIIKDTEWEIKLSSDKVYLEYTGTRSEQSGPIHDLSEMVGGSWHSSCEFEEGINLYFDDNIVTLRFKENNMIMPFAKKHGFKLVGSGIVIEVQKINRKAKQLEALIHQFNIKG